MKCQHAGVYQSDTCHREATHTVQYFLDPNNIDDEMQERCLCHEHAICWKNDVERYGGIAAIEHDIATEEK